MRPREIRELVERTFESLRSTPQRLTREALLIRDGHYCGHRYESGDLSAIWLLEKQQVRFFNKQGDVLLLLQTNQLTNVRRRAA